VATLLLFNQELAALLRSGLPLIQGLDMMLERQRDPFFLSVLTEIRDRVGGGEEFSDAVAGFENVFPPLYASTIKAGERSGELEQVIRRFIRYQKIVTQARKRIVSALIYPVVLVGLSIVLIGILTVFVIPRFTEFYSGIQGELPLLTRITVGFSLFARNNIVPILVILAVASIALVQWSRTEFGGIAIDRLRLRIPLVGKIFHSMAISEFCRSLATLLTGGIPLVAAQQVSVGAVSNAYVRQQLGPTVGKVREGESLHSALESTGVAPELAIDMVKVGEATGALDEMLGSVSDFMDEEVETKLQRVLTLIEPIMLIFMGAIVAILLVSVYLPLVNLMSQVDM